MRLRQLFETNLIELFDKPYPYTLNIGQTDAEANIILPDKSKLNVGFLKGKNKWDMAFSRNGSFDAEDQGDQYKVLSTVVAVFMDFVNKVKPAKITFDADKDSTGSRVDVYTKMLNRYASKMGYDFSVKNLEGDSILQFTLTKKKLTVENAATGEKTVGLIFGRFNPPHQGHKNAWQMASKNDEWFIGTNESTVGPKDPLPAQVKVVAMETIWPEAKGHIVFSQSWLTLASELYNKYPNHTLRLYTDEEWVPKTINQYNGQQGPHGSYNFKNVEWVKPPRLASATDLRAAVLNNDPEAFARAAGVPADTVVDVPGQNLTFFDLVKKYLEPHREKLAKK